MAAERRHADPPPQSGGQAGRRHYRGGDVISLAYLTDAAAEVPAGIAGHGLGQPADNKTQERLCVVGDRGRDDDADNTAVLQRGLARGAPAERHQELRLAGASAACQRDDRSSGPAEARKGPPVRCRLDPAAQIDVKRQAECASETHDVSLRCREGKPNRVVDSRNDDERSDLIIQARACALGLRRDYRLRPPGGPRSAILPEVVGVVRIESDEGSDDEGWPYGPPANVPSLGNLDKPVDDAAGKVNKLHEADGGQGRHRQFLVSASLRLLSLQEPRLEINGSGSQQLLGFPVKVLRWQVLPLQQCADG